MEKFIDNPRHIEIQVQNAGNISYYALIGKLWISFTIHLGETEDMYAPLYCRNNCVKIIFLCYINWVISILIKWVVMIHNMNVWNVAQIYFAGPEYNVF